MDIIAELKDADTTVTLAQKGEGYVLQATRYDSTSVPQVVLEKPYGTLSEAIKAILVFYVEEWESVFVKNRLSEKLEQAIATA